MFIPKAFILRSSFSWNSLTQLLQMLINKLVEACLFNYLFIYFYAANDNPASCLTNSWNNWQNRDNYNKTWFPGFASFSLFPCFSSTLFAALLNTIHGYHGNTLAALESWGQSAEIPRLVNKSAIWTAGCVSEFVKTWRHQPKVISARKVAGTGVQTETANVTVLNFSYCMFYLTDIWMACNPL